MNQTLLEQGVDLLVYGMGSVFVFLALLVACTMLMSRVVIRFFPEPPAVIEPVVTTGATASAVSPHTLSIIQAAIDKHRGKHR